MSPPKTYNIIIVPSDHSGTRQLQVSRTLLITAVSVAALVVITLTIFAATYTSVLSEARRAQGLELENERLSEQVERVHELSRELESISGLRAQVFNMLGASDEDAGTSIRQRPVDVETADSFLRDVERLQALFAEEARRPFAPRAWPVEGRVRREFFGEAEGSDAPHPGLSLDAVDGEAVKSAGAGRVLSVEPSGDLTQRIEIDHGYGFRSIYDGMARTDVQPGQAVARGQSLGRMGSTGAETGNQGSRIPRPVLYFELRVDGNPVDPRSYLTPR